MLQMENSATIEVPITLSKPLKTEQLIKLAHSASAFRSYILIFSKDIEINAKSILSIMTLLESETGDQICLSAKGTDAEESLFMLSTMLKHFIEGEDDLAIKGNNH